MKKHLSLVLRTLFALAGIAYIAYSLTWIDQVAVPAGTVLPSGVALEESRAFRVVQGRVREGKALSDLVLLVDEGPPAVTMPVPAEWVGEDPQGYHVKAGILTTLRAARWSWLVLGLLLIGPVYPIQAFRWWLLMRARGLEVTVGKAFKLTMVGCFFNYCMPGTTGGDLVKAYYAARNSARRADAVMSVIFDRITGLLGLVLLSGLAGLFMSLTTGDKLVARVTLYIWLAVAAIVVVSAVYFSRRLRSALGLDWVLSKLPESGIPAKIDQAAVAYRDHKLAVTWAILISLPVHLMLATATAMAAYALGMDALLGLLLTVIPIVFLAGAVPLTYQGLGVMEGLAIALLRNPPDITANHIVGMLLMIRVYQVLYSLLGSIYLLKGDIHVHPPQETEGV